MTFDLIKVFVPAVLAFGTGMLITPFITRFLYRHEMWKKKAKTVATDGRATPIFNALHAERETKTPRLGGVIIWLAVLIVTVGLWLLAQVWPLDTLVKLDFLSRGQTWIPLVTLLIGAVIGLLDDLLEIRGGGGHIAGGLSLTKRLILVGIVSFLIALWFYFKLEVQSIGLPFWGEINLGIFFIVAFVAVTLLIYSGGIIDGIDGLAGGVLAIIFASYTIIAFSQNQINLAAFGSVVVGALLAFLWFNIPPARFYMSETGSMSLTIALTMVAFMTDHLGGGIGVGVLPIIALPLIVTTASTVIQLASKKFRNGKKVFLVAPIHHHFEAKGWPPYKVTMRYWIITIISAIIGVVLALFH